MEFAVHDTNVKQVSVVELPDALFGQPVRKALLWEMVRAQRASARSGTHATKDRAQVSGSGAKPFKQKGTGRARQGSARAPNMVGGGMCMGPRPRDYGYRLPRKARKAALASALSARVNESNLLVLDAFALDAPKTKAVVEFLGKVGSSSALIVDVQNDTLRSSTRNLEKSKYIDAAGLNVYDVLKYEKLVLTQGAIEVLVARGQAN